MRSRPPGSWRSCLCWQSTTWSSCSPGCVRDGLQAAIMAAVFLAFATADVASLTQFGAGLTIAVIMDATVVRLILLLAIMHGLGPRAWWIPRWLDERLPNIEHMDLSAVGIAAEPVAGEGDTAAAAELPPSLSLIH